MLILGFMGSEHELRVCRFVLEKNGRHYLGWTYLLSVKLGPVTANPENPTSVLIRNVGENKTTELSLFKAAWTPEAPALSDLHLELVPL